MACKQMPLAKPTPAVGSVDRRGSRLNQIPEIVPRKRKKNYGAEP